MKQALAAQRLRPMVAADLETVLSWRNHPEVRRHMYTRHEISLDEHARWFERASRDPERHLLVFEHASIPVGFVNIHRIAPGAIADWGFYASPQAARGTGFRLGQSALQYAFSEIGLHKLCGQVIACNGRSIRLHQKLGFQQEGVLRQQHFDAEQYHDVVCFGLLASEWHPDN